jgi:hypothetical protein
MDRQAGGQRSRRAHRARRSQQAETPSQEPPARARDLQGTGGGVILGDTVSAAGQRRRAARYPASCPRVPRGASWRSGLRSTVCRAPAPFCSPRSCGHSIAATPEASLRRRQYDHRHAAGCARGSHARTVRSDAADDRPPLRTRLAIQDHMWPAIRGGAPPEVLRGEAQVKAALDRFHHKKPAISRKTTAKRKGGAPR